MNYLGEKKLAIILIDWLLNEMNAYLLFPLTGGEMGGFESLLFEFGEDIC